MEIQIEHLNKAYGKRKVLKDINLRIPAGMYGLLGENGAGKTTLLRILSTLSEPDSGSIQINGIGISQKKEIRRIIGFLPQEFSVYPNMSVCKALDYLGILSELPSKERRERIISLLKLVNLEQEKDTRFKNLSGGMKRRFGIAQALLNHPEVLLVDEPTAGLDPEERLRFYNLLAELSGDRIILLSTHIAADLQAVCSNAAVLSDGHIVFAGSIPELVKLGEGRVYSASVRREDINAFRQRYRVVRISPDGANLTCRFLSDSPPPISCTVCEAELEDSYMYLLSNYKKEGK